MTNQATPHQAIEELIPWYVNGTLNEADMAVVSRHVARCQCCQTEVSASIRESQALHETTESQFSTLLSKEANQFAELQKRLPVSRQKIRRVAWQPALATVAALLIAVLIPVEYLPETARRQHASFEARTAPPASHHRQVVQVIFRADTPEQTIHRLFWESGAEVLGSPTAAGVYRIGLQESVGDPNRLLERLQSHPAVRWAVHEQ